jgi:hypothetical protein
MGREASAGAGAAQAANGEGVVDKADAVKSGRCVTSGPEWVR